MKSMGAAKNEANNAAQKVSVGAAMNQAKEALTQHLENMPAVEAEPIDF